METQKNGVIYKIMSPTGKIYIGKTINFKVRMSCYKTCNGISSQKMIYNSIIKYGWDAHVVEVIKEAPEYLLSELEIFYIKEYKSYHYDNKNGMNLTLGGDGTSGRKDSEETKLMRAKHHIGSKRSSETKKLMSLAKKDKPNNKLGKKLSPESVERVRLGQIGLKRSQESINNRNKTLLANLISNHECILQINPKNDEIIKEWVDLPKNISNKLGIDDSSLVKCLKNKLKTVGGFIWKFKKIQ